MVNNKTSLRLACMALLLVSIAGCTLSPSSDTSLPPLPASTATAAPAAEDYPTAEPANLPTNAATATLTDVEATAITSGEQAQDQPTTQSTTSLSADVAAVVNGVTISMAEYQEQVAQAESYYLQQPGIDLSTEAGQQALKSLHTQVLDWLIDRILVQQAAASLGIAISDAQVDAEIQRMQGDDAASFEKWLQANGLTRETLRRQLATDLTTAAVRDAVTGNLSRRVLQIHVRHILTSTEAAAQAAEERLRAGENFITLAREVSEDETTRANGGDLGFLPEGVMPPAFDEVAFAMQAGEISGVVQSDFGYHIIQVVEIDPAREVSDDLWPMVQQKAFDDWLSAQRAQAEISINQAVLQ